MQCEKCGTPLDHAGQGHTCRTGAAPVDGSTETFALATRRVVRFGIVYAVVVVVANGLGLAGYTAIRSGAADPTSVSTQASVLIGGAVTGLVGLVCLIGLLVSAIVWVVSAHRLPSGAPGVLGYGALLLWLVLDVLAYVVPPMVPTLDASAATETALRLGGLALLITGVLTIRSRVRRETGLPALAARPKLVTSEDWDASKWDPEVLQDIERRRGNPT